MRYKNPHYKKTKRSLDMLIFCGVCKIPLINYKKVGKGALFRLWLKRVLDSELDLEEIPDKLECPNCGNTLGSRTVVKGETCYRMNRSYYETRLEY